jgi:hypothetical protein
MRKFPILVIAKCRFYIDAFNMELTRVDKPDEKMKLEPKLKKYQTETSIYFDEKEKRRVFPNRSAGKLPAHVVLYVFPAIQYLDPYGFALRKKSAHDIEKLKRLDPGITIAVRQPLMEVKKSQRNGLSKNLQYQYRQSRKRI